MAIPGAYGLLSRFCLPGPELAFTPTVVAKVEWHRGELFPRVGFTDQPGYPPKGIVRFYNGRHGGAMDKRRQIRLELARLSCHKFVANQVRLALFVLAYNLGNFCEGWPCRSR